MNDRFLARAKKNDRLAAWLINIGGFFVILSVIGILVLILKVAIPLFLPSGATVVSTVSLSGGIPSSRVLAVGADDDLTTGYLLDESGIISFFDTQSGRITETAAVPC